MTIINRLIKEAKSDPRPERLVLPSNHVRTVAEHARSLMFWKEDISCDDIEAMIRRGEMKLLGIPVVVR